MSLYIDIVCSYFQLQKQQLILTALRLLTCSIVVTHLHGGFPEAEVFELPHGELSLFAPLLTRAKEHSSLAPIGAAITELMKRTHSWPTGELLKSECHNFGLLSGRILVFHRWTNFSKMPVR